MIIEPNYSLIPSITSILGLFLLPIAGIIISSDGLSSGLFLIECIAVLGGLSFIFVFRKNKELNIINTQVSGSENQSNTD